MTAWIGGTASVSRSLARATRGGGTQLNVLKFKMRYLVTRSECVVTSANCAFSPCFLAAVKSGSKRNMCNISPTNGISLETSS